MTILHRGARFRAATVIVGFSLAWPQVVGVASADNSDKDTSTVSAGSEKSGATPNSVPRAASSGPTDAASSPEAPAGSSNSTVANRTAVTGPRAAAGKGGRLPRARANEGSVSDSVPSAIGTTRSDPASATEAAATADSSGTPKTTTPTPATQPTATALTAGSNDTPKTTTPTPATEPTATAVLATSDKVSSQRVNASAAALPSVNDLISNLVNGIQTLFEGVSLPVRRALFNQAPTVLPVQTSGKTIGLIGGSINAVDPEDDQVIYTYTQPVHGTVTIDSAGNFTYIPTTSGWTGTDTFNVSVKDSGLHINLFDLGRPANTNAIVTVEQNGGTAKVGFSFIFGDGARYWSSEARAALEKSALDLGSNFVVTTPVIITYTVTGDKDFTGNTLAATSSDPIKNDPGFFGTVVQHKIQTGEDINGPAADGEIYWNFRYNWALGDSVASNQYDFTATATHELLHSFGFLSAIDSPGNNNSTSWTDFDRHVVAWDGTKTVSPIDRSTYIWNTAYNANLIGGGTPYGGLYFYGPNAVLAYGGKPVPLYTPLPWKPGSSMSHLDDATFTGADAKLMNAEKETGRGVRTLSAVEIGILEDLGYTIANSSQTLMIIIIGFAFLGRRHRV